VAYLWFSRGRGAVGVEEGLGCGGGAGPFPSIQSFLSQNDKSGCTLTQYGTDRKHRQSLQALGHGFCGSIAKQSVQNSAKILQKFTVRPKRGRRSHPPPWIRHWLRTTLLVCNCGSNCLVCSRLYCSVGTHCQLADSICFLLVHLSVRPFVSYQVCEHDIWKMNKPILMH